jgi:hypothetical protein
MAGQLFPKNRAVLDPLRAGRMIRTLTLRYLEEPQLGERITGSRQRRGVGHHRGCQPDAEGHLIRLEALARHLLGF